MHYAAIVGDVEREVEVVEISPGQYSLQMDGKHFEIDAQPTSHRSMSFLLDNHVYNIEFETDATGGEHLLVRGQKISVEVLDLRKMRLRRSQNAKEGTEGPMEIVSPMPGKIVAVLVKEGQRVAKGDGLLVVEAMKMENELKSPKDGVVHDLTVEEGATVEGQTPLCRIE